MENILYNILTGLVIVSVYYVVFFCKNPSTRTSIVWLLIELAVFDLILFVAKLCGLFTESEVHKSVIYYVLFRAIGIGLRMLALQTTRKQK